MSTTVPREVTQQQGSAPRSHNISIHALFALAQLAHNILHLRRNPRSWQLFRVALGLAGAALVILPLSLWNSWTVGITGLAMFTAAILLPRASTETRTHRKARELGAPIVLDGGKYQPGNAPVAAVQIFVSAENIWALDSHFQPLLVIPTSQISSVRAEESAGRWNLQIRWLDHTAEFSYRGIFAELLARRAETSLRSALPAALPAAPKRRAAGA
ncbi:MAG: hypothetical protein ACHQLQ_09255 [Candidatus Acidiferrales bacterium]